MFPLAVCVMGHELLMTFADASQVGIDAKGLEDSCDFKLGLAKRRNGLTKRMLLPGNSKKVFGRRESPTAQM